MRKALDIAYPQLELDRETWGPPNYDQLATAGDAFWVRWTDYKYWLEHNRSGADTYYNEAMSALRQQKPTGPYMYAGAGYGTAKGQIDDWAAGTSVQPNWYPMYDLEMTLIKGNQLTDWCNVALARIKEIWGLKPVFYVPWNAPAKWGLSKPSVDCWIMVPEYPSVEQTWANRGQWEALCFGRPGFGNGPDTPWGDWDIWQSLHLVTGVPGLAPDRQTDFSFVKDRVFEAFGLGTASVGEDDDMAKMKQVMNRGTVWAIDGATKTPINSEAVRQEWMRLGLIDSPSPVPVISDAALAELIRLTEDR